MPKFSVCLMRNIKILTIILSDRFHSFLPSFSIILFQSESISKNEFNESIFRFVSNTRLFSSVAMWPLASCQAVDREACAVTRSSRNTGYLNDVSTIYMRVVLLSNIIRHFIIEGFLILCIVMKYLFLFICYCCQIASCQLPGSGPFSMRRHTNDESTSAS